MKALFGYNPATRGLDRHSLLGVGLRAADLRELMCRISALCHNPRLCSAEALVTELGELVRFRALFSLLPEACLFGDPVEDKPIIREHLASMGVAVDEDLVRAIKFVCENFRSKRRGISRKMTISDVYCKAPEIYSRVMKSQGERCATCGLRLSYGNNIHLDHMLPWHLGDDPTDGSNWQFLCGPCNRGKGVYPYYSLNLVGVNWLMPDHDCTLREDVRYAALVRDGRCTRTGRGPMETELTVVKRRETGCWILDNVATIAADLQLLSPQVTNRNVAT